MVDDRPPYASHQEIEQLRDEVRRLKEEQVKPKDEKKDEKDEKTAEPKKPHPVRRLILIALVIVLAVVGLLWWLHSRNLESTDDAIVDGHTSGLAARIAGTVVAVYVEENHFVKAGQVVVDLDPRDYQA